MSECIKTDKPQILILMAVYEPEPDWLRAQLKSLNAQTYPNLRLHIRDDCSHVISYEQIQSCVRDCISAFPYEMTRNEQNIGSNKTFERLTQGASGPLVAYCDQDDIWLPEKLATLEHSLTPDVQLAYCDMQVIDGSGRKTADSLRLARPRLHYRSGLGQAPYYTFANCTAGCCMLMRADVAKRAVPFPEKTVCDQWLCMVAAHSGAIAFVNRPLMQYRIHSGNQTGILTGVETKSDYRLKRLLPMWERAVEFDRRFGLPPRAMAFAKGRLKGRLGAIFRYRTLCEKDAYFELAMRVLPEVLFRRLLKRMKRVT